VSDRDLILLFRKVAKEGYKCGSLLGMEKSGIESDDHNIRM
jgi:hypothetical protein